MHVLLIGASSFIGRHLAERLVRTGRAVSATYRTESPAIEGLRALNLTGQLELIPLDITDRSSFARLPPRVDAVVHVAGATIGSGISTVQMQRCNVVGTDNVLQHALLAGARRLVYMSTLSVHGRIGVAQVDENTPMVDPSPYGASKYEGERLLAAASDRLPCVALRLPGVLGCGAHRAWLPVLLDQMRAGQDVAIFNPDAAFNNAAHVDDLARFVDALVEKEWRGFFAFPVAARGAMTIRQVAERLRAASGARVRITVQSATRENFTVSSECATRLFGYEPTEIGVMIDRYCAETLSGDNP